ncbi:glycoside hydrolase family 25 [Bacillus wiedmannii]|uniref:N-acetylmuramoyl-L-alanine amidase n=1 Tax=Bacillus wiedmannii TaxID=1890302 RepID=UPI000BFBB4B9|nr:N-acetylmuramoyl-L-alanine amidase [Bacillus wiedmannii]PHB03632.1 glycoside hydrolase family 25 [Bacillus wiedmannii]
MYNLITVHAGHNFYVVGASANGYKEEVETRRVKNRVLELLRQVGQNCVDTTDEDGRTQQQNLANIIRNCNSHPKAGRLDIAIHFNQGASEVGGTEVWYYDQSELARKMSAEVAAAMGIRDRGPKEGKELAVLNGTNAPAILIEVAFLGHKGNMDAYERNFDKVAQAIVKVVTGKLADIGDNNPIPDVDTRQNVSLPPDWQTNNLGWLRCVERQSWVYKNPNELAEVAGKIPFGSGHVYLANAWDGKRFWLKIANDNWVPETAVLIEKDGKSKGVIWNTWNGLECYHHANYNSGIRDRVGVGQWEVELRDDNWIYIKDKGWIEFDEKVIRWIR